MRAENQRPIMLKSASSKAIMPTAKASSVTNWVFFGMTPSSINLRNSKGVVTIKIASITTVIKKNISDTL